MSPSFQLDAKQVQDIPHDAHQHKGAQHDGAAELEAALGRDDLLGAIAFFLAEFVISNRPAAWAAKGRGRDKVEAQRQPQGELGQQIPGVECLLHHLAAARA